MMHSNGLVALHSGGLVEGAERHLCVRSVEMSVLGSGVVDMYRNYYVRYVGEYRIDFELRYEVHDFIIPCAHHILLNPLAPL